DTGIYYCT
nr:immunoglobulin heavy chain junction region [Mus musculus]